jgi:hypothetical protein
MRRFAVRAARSGQTSPDAPLAVRYTDRSPVMIVI